MVFDINRAASGLILIITLFFSYFFKLDLELLFILSCLILYDLYYSKIIKSIKYLFFLVVLFIIVILIKNILILKILFIASIILSIIFHKFLKIFFLFSLVLFVMLSYKLIILDSKLFYMIILFSFINDTSAYFFGRWLKGPLITPNISPKKTYSGTLFSFVISSFLLYYFTDYQLIISILMSSSFFFGDIYFSFIKRKFLLKDFSNLLRGHGGILDRIDSIFLPIFILNLF